MVGVEVVECNGDGLQCDRANLWRVTSATVQLLIPIKSDIATAITPPPIPHDGGQ